MKATIQGNGLIIYLMVAYDFKNMILLWTWNWLSNCKTHQESAKSNHGYVLICHPEH